MNSGVFGSTLGQSAVGATSAMTATQVNALAAQRAAMLQDYMRRNAPLNTPESQFNAGYRDATVGDDTLTAAQFGCALASMRSNAAHIAINPPVVLGVPAQPAARESGVAELYEKLKRLFS